MLNLDLFLVEIVLNLDLLCVEIMLNLDLVGVGLWMSSRPRDWCVCCACIFVVTYQTAEELQGEGGELRTMRACFDGSFYRDGGWGIKKDDVVGGVFLVFPPWCTTDHRPPSLLEIASSNRSGVGWGGVILLLDLQ